MPDQNLQFTDEELEQELGSWEITSLSNGFASSYKTLYKTNFTTIAAKSFLIPDQETGEIHHFNLSIRVFKRRKKSDPWIEQSEVTENEYGQHKQLEITAGSGRAVKGLTDFLLSQYELIGTKIESNKVIIDQPSDYDIEELLKKMTLGQLETFNQGVRINSLKEISDFWKKI